MHKSSNGWESACDLDLQLCLWMVCLEHNYLLKEPRLNRLIKSAFPIIKGAVVCQCGEKFDIRCSL